MSPATRNELRALSTAEKIQLVEDLWDWIVEADEDIGLTEAQKRELDRRLAEHEADPQEGISLDEFRRELRRHQ
jgi:putative addiction module component (TIGR02574 family)